MSILSAFVAYVVVDWCSGVDWLVVGFVAGLVVVVSLVLIVDCWNCFGYC